jgi:Fe-S cluster assembly protein SufD
MRSRDHSQVEHYAQLSPEGGPGWLAARRADAVERLAAHGFPGRRDEDWWNTPARAMLAAPFVMPDVLSPVEVALPDGPRVVLVDGRLDAARSRLEGGLQALSASLDAVRDDLGALLAEPLGFDALNTALACEGAVLEVPDGVTLEAPVHLVHVCTGAGHLGVVRSVLRLGRGARATVVEHWLGAGAGAALTSGVTEVHVGPGAVLEWVALQDEDAESHHVGTLTARVEAGGALDAWSVVTGAAVSRTELRVELAGAGARTGLRGLSLLRGAQHADHHVLVDHATEHGTSTQTFRSILADRAHSVFTGKVVVREGAQHTDSSQSNDSLLLSDEAVAGSRPQLEIYADDVACQHGATVGSLDDEALFYLRTRGLAPVEARGLLIGAFATEVVQQLPEVVRPQVQARIDHWLEDAR